MQLRTLLIDDEPAAIRRLRELLKNHRAEIRIIGEADNGLQAVKKTNRLKPDLLFLDINLAGKDAFSVIEEFTCEPAVIFTTGYDQYAVRAFECNALDYLLKPIDPQRLQRSIQRLFTGMRNVSSRNTVDKLKLEIRPPVLPPLTRIQARIGDTIHLVKIGDVLYFEAEDYYCAVHTDSRKLLIRMSLQELDQRLPPGQFVRIHRKYFVNFSRIKRLRSFISGTVHVILDDHKETSLPASRGYSSLIRQSFQSHPVMVGSK